MASTLSPPIPISNAKSSSCEAHATRASPAAAAAFPLNAVSGRRQLLFLATTSVALTAKEQTSRAQDIGLFGLRKNLRKVEEEAEEIVKEGFEAADKGLQSAERGVEAAESEISSAVSFGGLAQAGAVAGAEVLGILVATAIVNGTNLLLPPQPSIWRNSQTHLVMVMCQPCAKGFILERGSIFKEKMN